MIARCERAEAYGTPSVFSLPSNSTAGIFGDPEVRVIKIGWR